VGTNEEKASTRLLESQGSYRCRTVMQLSLPDGYVVRPDDVPDEVGQTVEVDVTGEC
jgi:hypothetical protein